MRSAVIFLCLTVFILLRAADPLICPDGCTDEPGAQTTSDHGPATANGDCLVCTGGLASPVAVALLMSFEETDVAPDADAVTISVPAPQLERPPRLT